MARYVVMSPMLTLPKPMPIVEASTPAEAVRIAREFESKGRRGLQIGDMDKETYVPLDEFAAEHGIR